MYTPQREYQPRSRQRVTASARKLGLPRDSLAAAGARQLRSLAEGREHVDEGLLREVTDPADSPSTLRSPLNSSFGSDSSGHEEQRFAEIAAAQLLPLQQQMEAQDARLERFMTQMEQQTQLLQQATANAAQAEAARLVQQLELQHQLTTQRAADLARRERETSQAQDLQAQ